MDLLCLGELWERMRVGRLAPLMARVLLVLELAAEIFANNKLDINNKSLEQGNLSTNSQIWLATGLVRS